MKKPMAPLATPEIDAAVAAVARAAEFGLARKWGGFPSNGLVYAVATLNHVAWAVSPMRLGSHLLDGGSMPEGSGEAALAAGAGLCGHNALAFAAIMRRFGYELRSVQFWWQIPFGERNHVACEVLYDDDWHYFDPNWAAFWEEKGEALPIATIREGAGTVRRDETLLWHLLSDWGDFGFVSDPETRVVIDGSPLY